MVRKPGDSNSNVGIGLGRAEPGAVGMTATTLRIQLQRWSWLHSTGLRGARARACCAPLSGMRKLIVLGLLVTAVFGLAPVAWAAPSVPTCLISNGGSGGRFTKSLLCVELVNLVSGRAGSGSYSVSGDDTPHWLTETVEYRALGRAWVPLATATTRGTGTLRATTRMVRGSRPGALRACTRVGTDTSRVATRELCSTPN